MDEINMKTEEQNENNESYKDARLKFIIITIALFVLAAISIYSYTATYTNFREEILQLPLAYAIPSLLVLLPIILSVTTVIIFIRSLDIIKKNMDSNDENNESIFYNTLKELRNPTNKNNKKRKVTLITLFILSIVSLLATQSYIMIIVYFVL